MGIQGSSSRNVGNGNVEIPGVKTKNTAVSFMNGLYPAEGKKNGVSPLRNVKAEATIDLVTDGEGDELIVDEDGVIDLC
jgi:hypothetical protein